MKKIIESQIGQRVVKCTKISGGFSFETWLIELENGKKVIFRTGEETEIQNGKKFIPIEIFRKEKIFYDIVNELYPERCPSILIIDIDKSQQAYQIMSYIEGVSLDKYIPNINEFERKEILKDIGRITAEINNIRPSNNIEVFTSNSNWEELFSTYLNERLCPLLKDELITAKEIEQLNKILNKQKIQNNQSLLHLDMRLPNLIYKDGIIHVIDSENSTIGDPLYEIAIISVAGLLTEDFLDGYNKTSDFDIDMNSILFEFYKLERQAALVNLFANILKNKNMFEQSYISFTKIRDNILSRK